ncbi:MAG: SDR family oxidoreductase [Hyphomicrobiaceae bacterium]
MGNAIGRLAWLWRNRHRRRLRGPTRADGDGRVADPRLDSLRPGSDLPEGSTPFVLVTGASRGIGREIAREFARRGFPLALVARAPDRLAETAAAIAREHGKEPLVVAADLATVEGLDRVEAAIAAAGGHVDILVNNAAIGLAGPFAEDPPAAIRRLVDLDVRALADLMARFLPGMIARGEGGILNVASLAGLVPGPNQAAYYAAKAFVVSLTEAVASETAGLGIRVAAVLPGPVDTGFHRRMGAEGSYYLPLFGRADPARVARAAVRGFFWGRTLIVPGVLDHLYWIALRFTPHPIAVPLIGWMLKKRRADDHDL